jgi:hypothetical protein
MRAPTSIQRERLTPLSVARDLVSKLSGAVIIAVAVAMFLGGAFAGLAMIGRLGGAGWIIYFVVISAYALVFGPLLVSGVTLAQRGSRRRRAATAQRVEDQRRKFGLPTTPSPADRRARD